MADVERVTIRLRMSQADAHYGGDLVDGARLRLRRGERRDHARGGHLARHALRGAQDHHAPPRPLRQRGRGAGGAGRRVSGDRHVRRPEGEAEAPMSEQGEVVITAAVVGAEVKRAQSPYVPYTPAEIAQAAVDAWRAGAAVVHLHARWPDGRPSQEAAHFREIVDRIRGAGCDVVIQCSTGGAVGMSVDERLGALVEGAEMATLNLGSMNFGDEVFLNA